MFFFVAFALLVPAAYLWPDVACSGGFIVPEITVFWIDVIAIFFFEGLTLPADAMKAAAAQTHVHSMVQMFNLGLIPLATWFAVTRLVDAGWLEPVSLDGFLALACVPCTTSMCVMLSARSGGNAPLAAFNAVLSNTIAVVYTPTLLAALTTINPAVDRSWLAVGLCCKMIVPQLAGQVVRARVGPGEIAASMPKIVTANQTCILILLYQIISDVFKQGESVAPSLLLSTLALVVALHYTFFAAAWLAGSLLAPPERVAFLFSSTTKTVVLGVPMLRAVFGDRSPADAAVLMLPLVSYHLLELINGLLVSSKLKAWVDAQTRRKANVLLV
jgi:predicted Na+-dependent transporter